MTWQNDVFFSLDYLNAANKISYVQRVLRDES